MRVNGRSVQDTSRWHGQEGTDLQRLAHDVRCSKQGVMGSRLSSSAHGTRH